MKRVWWIALLLLMAALALLVAFFPASWAWHMLRKGNEPVQVKQVHGTVWHGHAEGLSYAGIDLGTLDWRLSPAQLWGRTDLKLTLKSGLTNGHAELTRHGDVITGRDIHLEMVVDTLPVSLGTPPMQPRGTLVVDIPHLVVKQRWPQQLAGYVAWQDSALADSHDTVPLGSLRADLSESNGSVIHARLSDNGGPLSLTGMAEASPLSWRVDAVLRTRKDTPLMHRVIAQFGQPSSDGSLHLDYHGGLALGNKP